MRPTYLLKYSQNAKTTQRIIYSAIQPTGTLHLGNYFGAVKYWVQMQNDTSTDQTMFVSIADLHSITTGLPKRQQLHKDIIQMAASLIACGIDPDRTVLFQQSAVPQHTQLAWVLSSVVTVAQLQRLSQYKHKVQSYIAANNIPIGLLTYPVLQAADILMYQSTHVPVGDDQRQHLEMCARIAKSFNRQIGSELFRIPEAIYTSHARVRSLRDPTSKMSKSDPDSRSRIDMTDDAAEVAEKCKRALTDSIGGITYDPVNRPALSSLIDLHASVTDSSPSYICDRFGHMNKVQYKAQLADDVSQVITPIRHRYDALMSRQHELYEILRIGARKANQIAERNMLEVYRHAGFAKL